MVKLFINSRRKPILMILAVGVTVSLHLLTKSNLVCTYVMLEENTVTIDKCFFRAMRPLSILGETYFSKGTGQIYMTVYNNEQLIGSSEYNNIGIGEGLLECDINTNLVEKGDELTIQIDLYRDGQMVDSQTIQVIYN